MKKKLAATVMAAMTMAAVAAGPASADDFDGDELLLFGYSDYSMIENIDYENVRERNDRDGECRVDDLDFDGFIAEYELTCYY
jgi:hypothetical protein